MRTVTLMLRILSGVYVIGCMAGLGWQLFLVSKIYFSYKVTTKLNIQIPDILNPQSSSFCARNTDILQFDRLNEKTGRNWSYSLDMDLIRKYQEELTVNDFFEFTPPVDQVIQKIMYREGGTFERFVKTGSQVYETFSVSKYAYLEYICYRMWDRTADPMTYRELAVTPTSPGMIYEIFLNETMIRSNVIVISLHGRNNYPFRSIKTCPLMWRQYNDETKHSHYNMFVNQQIRLTVKLLEPPFVSDCFDYTSIGMDSDIECIQKCVKRISIEKYDMIPFGVIVNETLKGDEKDLKMISYNNVANDVFGKDQLDIAEQCGEGACKRLNCTVNTAMTITTELADKDVSVIGLRYNVPSDPYITVATTAALNVVEFLTYAMSCVSTWTGLSIMSTEPVALIRLFKRKYADVRGRGNATMTDASDGRGKRNRNVQEIEMNAFSIERSHSNNNNNNSNINSRNEMRRKMLANISMMHHIASLSHRIQQLEEHHSFMK